MKTKSLYHTYRHYIDVSGKIGYEDIHIGGILFNEKFRNNFLSQFYSHFPTLKSFNKKGSALHPNKLLEVIEFMDSKRINMTCLKFPLFKYKKSLREAEQKIGFLLNKDPSISFPRERILSPLYFYLLKEKSFQNYHYEGQVCIESQILIEKVLNRLGYIARNHNYKFDLAINYRRNQHMLKFADFVASAGRKIDEFKLNNLKYYKIIKPDIEKEHLKLTFGINKIESDKQKSLKRFIE